MPFNAQDPQQAPWCGEEHSDTPYTFKQRVDSGFFYPEIWDDMSLYVSQSTVNQDRGRDFQNSQETLENKQPVWPSIY
jgi:hypothetical protein